MTEIHPINLGFDTCYVLKADGVVVLDAGQPRKERRFLEGLAKASIEAQEIGLILLTHAHWDHMGSAAAIRELTGAPLAVHEREKEWVETGDPPLPPGVTTWGKVFMAVHRLVMPLIHVPPAPVDESLGDEPFSLRPYGVPAAALPTPGHSCGSVSVLLESGEAFVGDLAMNRLPLRWSPGLPIFAEDPEQVLASWAQLLELGAKTVYPAHGAPFSANVMRRILDSSPLW